VALLSSSAAFGQLTADPEDRRDQGREPLRTQTVDGQPLPFTQRLRFGGGINGFRFGNPFSLGVSPVIAYQATEQLIIGVGGTYNYTRYKAPYPQPYTLNQYGGRGFVMYEAIPSIVPNLYLHGEVETTTIQQKVDNAVAQNATLSLTTPLLGLTYMQPISRRFGVNLTALYNLNYKSRESQFVYGSSPFILRLSFF
ncbi:MAG: hypothetical protein H7319_05920, partial [Spirosoma sp.]|nr:hypothetical protein [Spirosoma sp.]